VTDIYDALEKQCDQLRALVAEFAPDDWERPTRCPPMSVKDLVAHVAMAAAMTTALAAADRAGHEANADRARWWRSPNRTPPATILAAAQDESAKLDRAGAGAFLSEHVSKLIAQFRATPPDKMVGNEGRTITAVELAASRCL